MPYRQRMRRAAAQLAQARGTSFCHWAPVGVHKVVGGDGQIGNCMYCGLTVTFQQLYIGEPAMTVWRSVFVVQEDTW